MKLFKVAMSLLTISCGISGYCQMNHGIQGMTYQRGVAPDVPAPQVSKFSSQQPVAVTYQRNLPTADAMEPQRWNVFYDHTNASPGWIDAYSYTGGGGYLFPAYSNTNSNRMDQLAQWYQTSGGIPNVTSYQKWGVGTVPSVPQMSPVYNYSMPSPGYFYGDSWPVSGSQVIIIFPDALTTFEYE